MTLPATWVRALLGDVRINRSSRAVPSASPDKQYELWSVPAFADGHPERVRGADIGSDKQTVSPGTVLVCKINPRINRIWIVGPNRGVEQIASTEWIPFFPVDGIDSRYLAYYLQQNSFRDFLAVNVSGVGGSLMRVRPAVMDTFPFPVSPLSEQQRIVAALEENLSRLDAATAVLRRTEAMTLRYCRAVLEASCAGRLVESEASLSARENRPFEHAAGVVGRLQDLLRDVGPAQRRVLNEPDDGEHPPLPLGWSWQPLGRLGLIQGGIQKQPLRRPRTNKFPFLRVANVGRGTLDLSDVHEIELFAGELERLRLAAGDLLIVEGNGSRSEIGRLAEWSGAIENCVHQNHLIRFRAFPGISAKYIATYWNSVAGSTRVLSAASSSSGLYTLSVGKVARVAVPLPPPREQKRIVEEVDRRVSLATSVHTSIRTAVARAEHLRQSILKRAFEGRLVPQDPRDELATILLDRVRASCARSAPKPKRRRSSA